MPVPKLGALGETHLDEAVELLMQASTLCSDDCSAVYFQAALRLQRDPYGKAMPIYGTPPISELKSKKPNSF